MTDKLVADVAEYLEKVAHVKLAVLFGSYGTSRFHEKSDLDIAVAFSASMSLEDRLRIQSELSTLVKREVDLLDLQSCHGAILQEALCKGQMLVKKDPEIYALLLKRMMYEAEDEGRMVAITLNQRLKNVSS